MNCGRDEELGGGGVGVRRWSLGALKPNVAACNVTSVVILKLVG